MTEQPANVSSKQHSSVNDSLVPAVIMTRQVKMLPEDVPPGAALHTNGQGFHSAAKHCLPTSRSAAASDHVIIPLRALQCPRHPRFSSSSPTLTAHADKSLEPSSVCKSFRSSGNVPPDPAFEALSSEQLMSSCESSWIWGVHVSNQSGNPRQRLP